MCLKVKQQQQQQAELCKIPQIPPDEQLHTLISLLLQSLLVQIRR